MRIEKKCWPEYFDKVKSGEKTFELRLAEDKYNEGDTLVLKEWDPKTKRYTGRTVEKEVTYIAKTKNVQFWPKEDIEKYGYVVLALK